MTDAELIEALGHAATRYERRQRAGNSFAIGKAAICRDMVRRFNQYGRWASERQRAYAEALVRWSNPLPPRQQARAEAASAVAEERSQERSVQMSNTSLQRIAQLFAAAAVHGLRFPKIRLRRGEWKIIIYPARGSVPSAYYVRASSGTMARIYCGRINGDGEFVASNVCPLDVLEALREFAADPVAVARAYGHAVGSCCFCGHELTDGRSVAMGYGPVCAEHYGLEWGERRAASVVTLAAAEQETRRAAMEENRSPWQITRDRLRRERQLALERTGVDAINAQNERAVARLDPEDEDSHFM
jgi:hypothetical protein